MTRVAALAFCMIGAVSAHAEERTLRIATEGAYPPFTSIDASGKLVGWDMDIGQALCDEMKVKCEFIAQEWDGMIPALQAGKYDAINSTMAITPDRQKKVDFTKKYYQAVPAIIVKKDSDIKGVTKADLSGKTIATQASSFHYKYSSATYTDSTIKAYPTAEEEQLDLANGRVDAIEDDAIYMQGWLDSPAGACCKILGKVPYDQKYFGPGAGIAVKKGDKELLDKFNAAIDAIRANGKYKEISARYFKFDVYGE